MTSAGDYVTHQLHAKHTVVKRHATLPQTIATDTGGSDVSGNDLNGSDGKTAGTFFSGNDDIADGEADVIHYRIPVHGGKEVVVRLRENTRLLSPGAVVERKTRRYLNASDSEFRTLHARRGCQLTGTVLGDRASRAALAACHGLVSGLLTHESIITCHPCVRARIKNVRTLKIL